MATFGEMKTAIARRLIDDSNVAVTDVEIGEAINEAINYWKHKRFWFNQTSAALSIAADDNTVTLPADFLIDLPRNGFTVTQDSFTYQIKKVKPAIFDMFNNSTVTRRPAIYCYRDGELQFLPAADIDYSGNLYYLKDYTDFTTDGTQDNLSNDWTSSDKAERLTRADALARLHGELRQDEKMEAAYQAKASKEYSSLCGRTNALLKTGTLTAE